MSDRKQFRLKKLIGLPHLGQRILKTAMAVFLCMMAYILRGYHGSPIESCVAAIICMQPYRTDSKKASLNRITGTFMGAFWGLLFLLLMLQFPILASNMILVYFIMAIGVILSIYSSVLFRQFDSASLTAIVFICVVGMFPDIQNPLDQTITRLINTLTGALIASAVNSFQLPRRKHDDYIFFIRLQDLVSDRFAHVSSNIHVILNRLFDDGAQICLTSHYAPALLMSQMGMMNVNLPVIVMDGVAMYDIPEGQYINVIPIPNEDAHDLCTLLRNMDLGFRLYSIRNHSMMIYMYGEMNEGEKMEFDLMKRSPYRNYVEGEYNDEDRICFLRLMEKDDVITRLQKKLKYEIDHTKVRMSRQPQPRMPGYSGLYFFHADATIDNQKEYLLGMEEEKRSQKLVPVDILAAKDAYTSEGDAIHLLHQVRKIYEPVKFIKDHRKRFT